MLAVCDMENEWKRKAKDDAVGARVVVGGSARVGLDLGFQGVSCACSAIVPQ